MAVGPKMLALSPQRKVRISSSRADVLRNRLLAGGVADFQHQIVLLIVHDFEFARQLLGAVAEEASDGPPVSIQHLDFGNARLGADHEPQASPLRTAGIPPIALHLRIRRQPGRDDRPLADILACLPATQRLPIPVVSEVFAEAKSFMPVKHVAAASATSADDRTRVNDATAAERRSRRPKR